jgi:hypothetical protein
MVSHNINNQKVSAGTPFEIGFVLAEAEEVIFS